jgi:hypothetical protein
MKTDKKPPKGAAVVSAPHRPSSENATTVIKVKRVTVNVFFDGTLNNYYNANQRRGEVSSYGNDLSNIARMWRDLDKQKEHATTYIQGIGTQRGEADRTVIGAGLALGETGVKQRAETAMRQVASDAKKNGKLTFLTLNVFGFSRGAAAARYFIHLAKTEPWRFEGLGLSAKMIDINFVGLFDTVSSSGVSFANDVKNYHLNFEAGYARKVFHLCARDEYRKNFALTTIDSAKGTCNGYELTIPGAHSDVGGGYISAPWQEVSTIPHGTPYKAFILKQGWYNEEDSPKKDAYFKRTVHGEYYRVGLSIMVAMAEKYAPTIMYSAEVKVIASSVYASNVGALQKILVPYALAENSSEWDIDVRFGGKSAKWWRRNLFHMSHDFGGIANVINREHGGFERHIYRDNAQ